MATRQMNETNIRVFNWLPTWNGLPLGGCDEIDPNLELLLTEITAGSVGKAALDDRVVGLKGTIKVNMVESTSALFRANLPWSMSGGTNAVQTLDFADSSGTGDFQLVCEDITTAPIVYSATAATLVTNINTALIASGIGATAAGSAITAITLTFTGLGWGSRPVGAVTAITTLLVNATLTITSSTTPGVGIYTLTPPLNTSMYSLSQPLRLHPGDLVSTDLSRDYYLLHATPIMLHAPTDGEKKVKLEITYKIYPDQAALAGDPPALSYGTFGV